MKRNPANGLHKYDQATSDFRLPTADCRLPTSDFRLPTADCRTHNRSRRALHPARPALQHVGINHGGAHVRMAQQFLYGANIVARFQQMRAETYDSLPSW